MATTTNYGWTTPDDTALVKDGAAAIRTLGSSVDTTTKALNPSTTLGDIEYRSATANTNSRLGIGSTGQVLTVAAGVPSWATPATVSSGLTLINRSTFSGVASHTIDSVFSSTYKSYLVAIEFIFAATSTDSIALRYRYGSSTESGSSYYVNNINAVYTGSTVTNSNGGGITSLTLTTKGANTTNPISGFLQFNRVGNSSQAAMTTGTLLNSSDVIIHNIGGETITAQTYTGFQLLAASNITGAVSVYGLATS